MVRRERWAKKLLFLQNEFKNSICVNSNYCPKMMLSCQEMPLRATNFLIKTAICGLFWRNACIHRFFLPDNVQNPFFYRLYAFIWQMLIEKMDPGGLLRKLWKLFIKLGKSPWKFFDTETLNRTWYDKQLWCHTPPDIPTFLLWTSGQNWLQAFRFLVSNHYF